jgi:DNA-binding XRE family transcriptional regulator
MLQVSSTVTDMFLSDSNGIPSAATDSMSEWKSASVKASINHEIWQHRWHYTKNGMLRLIEIRRELTKQVLPSRSGYARRMLTVDRIYRAVLERPEKFLDPNGQSFGARIRRARLNHGWTQEQVAKAVGLQRRTIGRYETGERTPRATKTKLVKLLQRDLVIR